MSVYDSCEAQSHGDSANEGNETANGNAEATTLFRMMDCVSRAFQETRDTTDTNVRDFFLVDAGALIFFMQAGFAMVCAGAVRQKNVQNTLLKNLLDACGAALAFYLVGYAFAFGKDAPPGFAPPAEALTDDDPSHQRSFIGTSNFASLGPSASYWFFQYTLSATSVTIVAGTLAERCQMAAYLWYSGTFVGPIDRALIGAIEETECFCSFHFCFEYFVLIVNSMFPSLFFLLLLPNQSRPGRICVSRGKYHRVYRSFVFRRWEAVGIRGSKR